MTEIIILLANTICLGLFFALPGLMIEYLFNKNGIAPDRKWPLLLVIFGSTLVKNIWFQNLSWWYFSILLTLGMTLGVHRGDLWTTFHRGRWWWKRKNGS